MTSVSGRLPPARIAQRPKVVVYRGGGQHSAKVAFAESFLLRAGSEVLQRCNDAVFALSPLSHWRYPRSSYFSHDLPITTFPAFHSALLICITCGSETVTRRSNTGRGSWGEGRPMATVERPTIAIRDVGPHKSARRSALVGMVEMAFSEGKSRMSSGRMVFISW